MVSYLDRYVQGEIKEPFDVMRIFADLSAGQQHQLNRGMRAWFNYLQMTQQASEEFLNALRKAIPKDQTGVDVNVPDEKDILNSLRLMKEIGLPKYNALWNLTLDSGLRLAEATKLINNIQNIDVQKHNGVLVAPLSYFRKTKVAYYGFFTPDTMQLIKEVSEELNDRIATNYLTAKNPQHPRRAITSWKYLRKFAFDKMIELEIPESVADFIQGRTAKKIGAKHYMVLLRQAKKFYPRYATYITKLRHKALNYLPPFFECASKNNRKSIPLNKVTNPILFQFHFGTSFVFA